MTTSQPPAIVAGPAVSPFAGADVCRRAGLALPGEHATARSSMTICGTSPTSSACRSTCPWLHRRFDFTAITDPRWRLVAKELMLAMLAPRHPAVAPLPRAYRHAPAPAQLPGRLDETDPVLHAGSNSAASPA